MKNLLLGAFVIILLCIGCSKENIIPSDCTVLADVKVLSEKKKESACHYSEVYRYDGKIYTVPECCVCDMAYMAYDCDGNQLCEFDEECMIDFS